MSSLRSDTREPGRSVEIKTLDTLFRTLINAVNDKGIESMVEKQI